MMAELADANVFIRFGAEFYPFETFPGVWDWLAEAIAMGTVVLLPQVLNELSPRSQRFEDWLRGHGTASLPSAEMDYAAAAREVDRALQDLGATTGSVARFKAGADYALVAWALAGNHRVVTFELPEDAGKSSRRAKIPDVCRALDIPCASPIRMFADHGARFTWLRPGRGS